MRRPAGSSILGLIDGVRRRIGYRIPPLGLRAHQTLFGLLPERGSVELLPGVSITLNFHDPLHRTIYWQGTRYEYPTFRVLRHWIRRSDITCFFDVGANFGFYSLAIARHWPHLTVHAWEPNPDLARQLELTAIQNGLKVSVHRAALGSTHSKLTLNIPENDTGPSSLIPDSPFIRKSSNALSAVEVSVKRFDDFADTLQHSQPHAWIAKIDVEGSEAQVLTGMDRSLERQAFRGIVIELRNDLLQPAGVTKSAIIDLLASYGYVQASLPPLLWRSTTHNSFFEPRARNLTPTSPPA